MSPRFDLVMRGRAQNLAAGAMPIALNDPAGVPARRAGTVAAVSALAPGIVELVLTLSRPLDHRPGQHVRVALGDLPARDYVPTLRVERATELNELVFHVACGEGRVARALATGAIRPGDLARVQGPFGHRAYRPGAGRQSEVDRQPGAGRQPGSGRLVLVGAGAGFGAVWAIARAARCVEPDRSLVVVAGASRGVDLYAGPALDWLAGTGVADLVLCAEDGAASGGWPVLAGRVTDHLPSLTPDDVVHAAGPPETVAEVAAMARAAGATCHALPFDPAPSGRPALVAV